ncbi:MAG: phosphatase PAP2 family protein [Flavobacteriaceae bacterium]|nr:phosphatase PAP2 family protein [Flavobacteriaceae bacterium]|tara:strand:+ start:1991 stop:2569 length:579 start_codon:yes stop_codon:yes gene_type:complete
METLLAWDKTLFLWLNGLGTETFDGFWMLMTHRVSNVLLYLVIWVFYGAKYSWKVAAYLLLFTGLLILCTDQLTNLFKVHVGRLRPCYDEELKTILRLVKPTCGGRYGFFSGHASNSFALAVFFGLILEPSCRLLFPVLLFIAFLISYSRVYIGVHFPLDIFVGSIAGSLIGICFYRLWTLFNLRLLTKNKE